MPPIAEPIKTPHLDLSNSAITSSVTPPSANAFLPAVRGLSMNLSILFESFRATNPSVEKDLISPAILLPKHKPKKKGNLQSKTA